MPCQFTRLTGLLYEPRGHEKLIYLYKKILRLADKLPQTYFYKLQLEELICNRMRIVEEWGTKHYKIEENCNAKVEVMMLQAEAEFYLIRTLLKAKPWEPLIRPPNGQWQWPPLVN